MAFLVFKIEKIPDLSLNKYQTLANTGVEGVLKRHNDFLRQWHGVGLATGASFHLLYSFDNTKSKGNRLNLFFFIQAKNEDTLALVRPLVHKSPLSDFYSFTECELPKYIFKAGATLIKNERVAEIYNPLADKTDQIHFVPHWEVEESARLYDLFRMLEVTGTAYNSNSCCAYRVDLFPVSLVQETILKFSPIIKSLQGDNDIKLVSNAVDGKTDSYAQTVKKEYDDWMSNIQTSPHFRVNIYSFAENDFFAKMILNSAASEAISEGDFILAKIKPNDNDCFNILSRLNFEPTEYCQQREIANLHSWSTTFLLDEVVPFFRMPALFDGETIEIPKETVPKQLQEGIRIGTDTNDYEVNFPIKLLPRHAFFTGAPGSGKTYTMLYFINQLKKNNIPFLVLEPAKKEYRELLTHNTMKDVYLFSPHLQSKFPLRVNPMAFPTGVMLETHIESLLTALKGSFMFEGGVYKILSASVEKAYINKGWDIEDKNEGTREFPTLSDVYVLFEKELEENSSYDGDVKGNIRSFLETRLGILMERGTGELFNTSVSTISPEDWIEISAVVELEALSESAKNFFILLVCTYIRETLAVNPNGNIEMPVRHAIFIEEAHNIIAPTTQQSSSDTVDPKISATAFIVKMLAETRALREAVIIADQLPTVLAPEVTKNTGLKLIHRLTAQDDREYVGATVSATPLQLEQVANYSKGKALFYYEDTKKPFEVQVATGWKKPSDEYNFSIDNELYSNICDRSTVIDSLFKMMSDFKNSYIDVIKTAHLKNYQVFITKEAIDIADLKAEEILENNIAIALKKFNNIKTNLNINYDDIVSKYDKAFKDLMFTYEKFLNDTLEKCKHRIVVLIKEITKK